MIFSKTLLWNLLCYFMFTLSQVFCFFNQEDSLEEKSSAHQDESTGMLEKSSLHKMRNNNVNERL